MPVAERTSPVVTDRMRLTYALWFTMVFLVSIWGVFILNETLELGWRKHGIHPRKWDGLRGILTYPFLHGDWGHLWNNTMSFFTLNGFLFYFYRSIALRVWVWLFFVSGLMLWGLAVDGNHIGASGLIYGLAAFLFTSGVIRNNRLLLRVSLAVAFLYGGIVWWMLPIDDHVSWEGHLSGAIVGTALAILYRRQGPRTPCTCLSGKTPMPHCLSGGWLHTPSIRTPWRSGPAKLQRNQTSLTTRPMPARAQARARLTLGLRR